ncbi:transcriptional regulation of mitochondrial recombination-domain-containing protein [Pseudoneurospora amorphoporcata]|uniref:Large ribosomal subunit protein mL67 n=1 Tax=Pseudoneurospora amorphoporcata TaxID=241081 RepID=A0AAN6SEG3_9PEZI|nr:transcriptional regulation of mitochondrial recombination-domain-containing protein [Pseudoneurospora amorphoporcata]
MNSVTTSTVGRLALGVSRLSAVTNVAGAVRHASTHPTTAIPKPTAAIIKTSPLAEETAVELKSPSRLQLKSEPGNKAMPKGHGDRIWAFHHIEQGQVIYSTKPVISHQHLIRQQPFTGKNLVPRKIRKDYWRPLAMIEMEAKDQGSIGRSVYQKLREFKKRHELDWANEADEGRKLMQKSKRERGAELNDQKPNSVADMAAVLAGAGKGNLMWAVSRVSSDSTDLGTGEIKRASGAVEKGAVVDVKRQLRRAIVYWANEQDKFHAREWSDNVSHEVGIPGEADKKRVPIRMSSEEKQ